MIEEEVFIDAFLAEPENDLPKLVFADWLEERERTTEAWRIRTYLLEYRPGWQTAMQSDQHGHRRSQANCFPALVSGRGDDLWRLACLTLLDFMVSPQTLPLERVQWVYTE